MLSATFETLRSRRERALVLFVTAGDPSLDELPEILEALTEGGADVVEIGIPFSDPIADGPTIQASSQRALDRGVTPTAVLDTLCSCSTRLPVILMGYYNPIVRRGLDAFAQSASESGASGVIVSDLTPEEAEPWRAACGRHGLDTIFLAAPTSTDERLAAVCQVSRGFVYAVSRTGVTGARAQVESDVPELVRRLKSCTNLPVCVGFGISTPDHVREVAAIADGVVVGSWLVDKLAREWNGGLGRGPIVQAIRQLKEATRF